MCGTKSAKPGENTQVKFNQTGFYAYQVKTTWATGNVIVLGDDMDSLALEVRLQMAQAILSKEMQIGSPLWELTIGTPDNVLEIGILEDELERIPNAKEYYEKLYKEMIPFNVPIRIEFGQQSHPFAQK